MKRGTAQNNIGKVNAEIRYNTQKFLRRRMAKAETVQWIATLSEVEAPEREAVNFLLQFAGEDIPEPYRSAWHYITETWKAPTWDSDLKVVQIEQAIRAGAKPELFIPDIVQLVAPRPSADVHDYFLPRPVKNPRFVNDVLHFSLTSGPPIRLARLGLETSGTASFFRELVDRLESVIVDGLYIAGRLSPTTLSITNWVSRVTPFTASSDDEEDPDSYKVGVGPAAKLYYECLQRLSILNPTEAISHLRRLKTYEWPLTRRIWAAAALDPTLATPNEVFEWLMALDDDAFWNPAGFPEVAELRSRRFGDINEPGRIELEKRIQKQLPAKNFRAGLDKPERERRRVRIAVNEFSRILAARHVLSPTAQKWFDIKIAETGNPVVTEPTTGLYDTDRFFPSDDKAEYTLDDPTFLKTLNQDLSGRLWTESRPAMDFVLFNSATVFDRLSKNANPEKFPRIWAALASALANQTVVPDQTIETTGPRNEDLLVALSGMERNVLAGAIDGVALWMERTAKSFTGNEKFEDLWLNAWPAAVDATNFISSEKEVDPSSYQDQSPDSEKLVFESQNTPVGELMTAFLRILPSLNDVERPFSIRKFGEMRAAIMS